MIERWFSQRAINMPQSDAGGHGPQAIATPPEVVERIKNVGAIGHYDRDAECQNLPMQEMEALAAQAIGHPNACLSGLNRFKGAIDTNSRLFPVDLVFASGRGVWFRLANWKADGRGRIIRDQTGADG